MGEKTTYSLQRTDRTIRKSKCLSSETPEIRRLSKILRLITVYQEFIHLVKLSIQYVKTISRFVLLSAGI